MGWDWENVTSVQQGTSFATPSNYSCNVLLLLYYVPWKRCPKILTNFGVRC